MPEMSDWILKESQSCADFIIFCLNALGKGTLSLSWATASPVCCFGFSLAIDLAHKPLRSQILWQGSHLYNSNLFSDLDRCPESFNEHWETNILQW
jgi:hypothetical protein